jgi:hypothetical protein
MKSTTPDDFKVTAALRLSDIHEPELDEKVKVDMAFFREQLK